MEAHVLEDAVARGLTQRQMADEFGKSQTTIRWWLKKHNILTKQAENRQRGTPLCGKCGEDNPDEFYIINGSYLRGWCKACHVKYSVKRFRRYKSEAVEYKGGKCEQCGYDKCLGSLDFHHVDPTEKDPNWKKMRTWKFERVKDELDKCMLLCKNCHGELHWGDLDD